MMTMTCVNTSVNGNSDRCTDAVSAFTAFEKKLPAPFKQCC